MGSQTANRGPLVPVPPRVPTLAEGFNRYAYANNNPMGYVDPTGYDTFVLPWVAAAAAAAADALAGAAATAAAVATVAAVAVVGVAIIAAGDNSPEAGGGYATYQDAQAAKGPYKRPSGATTKAQRESVQGKPCVKCGADDGGKRVAGHKQALVKEHHETGSIDKQRMRETEAMSRGLLT